MSTHNVSTLANVSRCLPPLTRIPSNAQCARAQVYATGVLITSALLRGKMSLRYMVVFHSE